MLTNLKNNQINKINLDLWSYNVIIPAWKYVYLHRSQTEMSENLRWLIESMLNTGTVTFRRLYTNGLLDPYAKRFPFSP